MPGCGSASPGPILSLPRPGGAISPKTVAFETHLVAIRWYLGNYDVVSQTIADIQFGPLRQENRISDVSENPGYVDEAAVLSHLEFPKFLLPGESAARVWYEALPQHVSFILIHN